VISLLLGPLERRGNGCQRVTSGEGLDPEFASVVVRLRALRLPDCGEITVPASHCKWTTVAVTEPRLVVFAGLRNEDQPMGAHFYSFDGREFHFITTVADDESFIGRSTAQ
jgi:hypothetical protein